MRKAVKSASTIINIFLHRNRVNIEKFKADAAFHSGEKYHGKAILNLSVATPLLVCLALFTAMTVASEFNSNNNENMVPSLASDA